MNAQADRASVNFEAELAIWHLQDKRFNNALQELVEADLIQEAFDFLKKWRIAVEQSCGNSNLISAREKILAEMIRIISELQTKKGIAK